MAVFFLSILEPVPASSVLDIGINHLNHCTHHKVIAAQDKTVLHSDPKGLTVMTSFIVPMPTRLLQKIPSGDPCQQGQLPTTQTKAFSND